ncbi:ankyrin repeat domain-containing protein [Cordyceps javanica]|uniref:Ankyrin repeat domain-containing protein n=1 Tax=Cordyceps javanica TaxID=43265 RepID=A0A545VU41_9HYPO|nr:ankyrin repeat domain-containing protein [Cordyceps javanica]TQW05226.1 ankyrin repeat domain containing protein [Cordyceps javanica]
MANDEHEGASPKELLIEACRRNNTDLLSDVLAGRPDAEITALLNSTTTVMGNHLYHEAASRGNYEIIDLLLDQPDFECDPTNRLEGDTPLHAAVRWLNAEPPAQRPFGAALVGMMLEAGSNPRVRNKGGLTPGQLVDPANAELRALIDRHQYASQNAGDFVELSGGGGGTSVPAGAPPPPPPPGGSAPPLPGHAPPPKLPVQDDDDDAEFSGSDDEERAEWERRRRERAQR